MRALTLLPLVFLLAACGPQSAEPDTAAPAARTLPEGVWMKGDLHLHSYHSSDAADSPLPALIKMAEDVGMDYFMTTDHDNHVDGDVAGHTWADPDYRSDSLVMLYGAEWTTHRGHGNAISAQPYDHQRLYDARDDLDVNIGRVVDALGIHLSANHPAGGGDHFGFSYDIVKSIEVWSTPIWSTNANAMLIWDDMLKSGRAITGRGGSDAHHSFAAPPQDWTTNIYQAFIAMVGTPTTWVYARERTPEAVVEALDNGHVAVSANPNAERIELYADTDADGEMDLMMGDIARASGAPVTFRVDISGGMPLLPLYTVTVTKDGAEFGSYQVAGRSFEFTDTPAADGRSYYRVEVKGTPTTYPEVPGSVLVSGRMIGLSNPIYFNFTSR